MNRPVACWFGLSAALAVLSAVLLRDAYKAAREWMEIL